MKGNIIFIRAALLSILIFSVQLVNAATTTTTTLAAPCSGEILSVTHNAYYDATGDDEIDIVVTFKNTGTTSCYYKVYAYNDGGVDGVQLDTWMEVLWDGVAPGNTDTATLTTDFLHGNPLGGLVSVNDIKTEYYIFLAAKDSLLGEAKWVDSTSKCCGSCTETCPDPKIPGTCCGGCYATNCGGGTHKMPTVMVTEIKKTVDYVVCVILRVFEGIAVGLAALMIAIQGLKWMTSDDPETRKAAKYTIFHVIIALMIIIVAVQLITYLFWGMGIIEFMGCP